MHEYIGFGIILGLGIVLGTLLPLLAQILGPLRPKEKKYVEYESGMDPIGGARDRFSVKFYLVAMMFIIFDIEIIFMYPWAVQYKNLGIFGLLEMFVFVAILFVGYIYLLRKKGLDWD